MTFHRTLMTVLAMLLLTLPAAARQQEQAGQAPADAAALFAEAQAAFDKGLDERAKDSPDATASFERAASTWQRIIDEHGIHNGRLLYNIGNAHLLSGEVGSAILAYRRAEQYIAGDRHLVSNLQQARRRVRTHIEPRAASRVREDLLFWHDQWSTRARLLLLVIFSGVMWLWALARLSRSRRAWPRWPAWAAGVVAAALVISLTVEHLGIDREPQGVVMRDVTGRLGPSEIGYQPSFTDPLAEGVEFSVIEDRRDWLLARLVDGRETWLPRQAVTLVN
ncbi:MAG: hypothetical protein IT430_05780 [Phycisphaerales bacterium]|nr:hypothetical protein [Phycisphaerales bacterium]